MDKYPQSHRHQSPAGPPPRLLRSRSGAPAISLPELPTYNYHITQPTGLRTSDHRSKSSTRSRIIKGTKEDNIFNISPSIVTTTTSTSSTTYKSSKKKNAEDNYNNIGDGTFAKLLQRSKRSSSNGSGGEGLSSTSKRIMRPLMAPGPTSPSAWALSPGRISPCSGTSVAKPPCKYGKVGGDSGGGGGGGMSGVLKYFKQKKLINVQEAEFRKFCVAHCRLLQWRFANARAEASMSAGKRVAEKKIFNAWLEMAAIRKSNMEVQIQIHRLKQEIRLYHILNSQLPLLKQWARLDPKNSEAVSRMARKLSAASLNIPLVHDAKADVLAVNDAMSTAIGVAESIETSIMKFQSQVEKTCYLLTELAIMANEQKVYLGELEKWTSIVASLKEEEKSLEVHLIQMALEPKDGKIGILTE